MASRVVAGGRGQCGRTWNANPGVEDSTSEGETEVAISALGQEGKRGEGGAWGRDSGPPPAPGQPGPAAPGGGLCRSEGTPQGHSVVKGVGTGD